MEQNTTSPKMPRGIFFIVGSEAAERFSFYGMNAILVPFLTRFMMNAAGLPDHLPDAQANEWYHTFITVLYFLPVLGALAADSYFGKYRIILYLSMVYCLGHGVLAMNETRYGILAGLILIAIGAGGIKPCVSAYVGDQFGPTNKDLITRAFSWFYFAINFGSTFSTILIPYLLESFCKDVGIDQKWGPHLAFGTPGIFMLIATIIFWSGRKKYVKLPPSGLSFLREITQPNYLRAIGNLFLLVPFVAMFWAIWQQNFSAWVEQAAKLDRHFLHWEILPGQIQTVNPFFILTFLPLFSYFIYPKLGKIVNVTPLRRIGAGLFITVLAFLISAWIESRISAGEHPSFWWQVLAYAVLTAAEILVSVTHLEFSYTQAPRRFKSVVMSIYLLTISLGNAFTAGVNGFIHKGILNLSGANYYLFFCAIMFVAALGFIGVAKIYKGKTYIQQEDEV